MESVKSERKRAHKFGHKRLSIGSPYTLSLVDYYSESYIKGIRPLLVGTYLYLCLKNLERMVGC